MSIRLRDKTKVLHTVTGIRVRGPANLLHTVTRVRMRDNTNTLRTVYDTSGGVSVDGAVILSTTDLFKSSSGAASHGTVTSAAVTATGQYGTPPYQYYWFRVSGNTAITCSSSTAQSPTFSADVSNGVDKTAVWRCIARDSKGVYNTSPALNVQLNWIDTR